MRWSRMRRRSTRWLALPQRPRRADADQTLKWFGWVVLPGARACISQVRRQPPHSGGTGHMTGCCWRIDDMAVFLLESATCWCLKFWAGNALFEFASNILSCEQFHPVAFLLVT